MLSILAVNVVSIVVGIVVAAVLVGGFGVYIASKILAKKRGSCGCDCQSCAYCKSCQANQKKKSNGKI